MLRGISGGDNLTAPSNADTAASGLFPLAQRGHSPAAASRGDTVFCSSPKTVATAAGGVFQRTLHEMFLQTQVCIL